MFLTSNFSAMRLRAANAYCCEANHHIHVANACQVVQDILIPGSKIRDPRSLNLGALVLIHAASAYIHVAMCHRREVIH